MPYIGQRPATGEANSFKILDDISNYTLTFGSSDVNVSADTITAREHRFVTGQRVTYGNGGGTAPTGLSNGTVYYIIVEDRHTFKLATSASNAVAGTAINITGAGSGAAHTINVAFDGVNTKFKATHSNGTKADISQSGQLMVSVNGVLQQPHDNTTTPTTGYATDHTSTIIFSAAPAADDQFFGRLIASNFATFDISDNTVDNFTGDGSTSTFTLSKTPPNNESILVTIDGVVQYPDDNAAVRAYTVSENILDFASAPGSAVEIQVRHIGFAGASTGGISGFYGRTGNAVLKNTDNIVFNNATASGTVQAANVTVTGDLTVNGTTTTLDTALTEVDKLEVAANNTTVGAAITQSGTGDILNLYDGSTEVFSVLDGGAVRIGGNAVSGAAAGVVLQDGTGVIATRSSGSSPVFRGYTQGDSSANFTVKADGKLLLGTETAGISGAHNLTIGESGHGGITIRTGTTSAGAIYFADSTSGDAQFDGFIQYNQQTRYLRFGTAQTEQVRITSNGNVGIGTDNPSNLLHVYGQSRFEDYLRGNSTQNKLYILDDVAISATKKLYFDGGSNTYIDEVSADTLRFSTAGTERIRISGAGQIGMGKAGQVTPNGNSPLTIQESDSNSETICLRATNSGGNGSQPGIVMKTAAGGHIGGIYCDVNSDYMRLSTSGTDRVIITNTGELVSTNGTLRRDVSSSSFTVSGDTASNAGANINLYGASHSSLANVFRVRTGSTERFRITPEGSALLTTDGQSAQYSYAMKLGQGAYLPNDSTAPHYGLWVRQLGPRYELNYGVYSEVEDDNGFYGGETLDGLSSVRGVGVFGGSPVSSQSYQKSIGVYGKATNESYNYNTIIGVRGRVETGTTTFTANNGQQSFGGHFVATGKSDVIGVYADAYLAGSPGANQTAAPLVVASNGSEKIRVDDAGRLLIGRTSVVASSAERLTIDNGMALFRRNSASAAAVYIRNEDSAADTRHPYLIFMDGGGNRGGFGIQNDASRLWISGQNGISFRTSGSAPSQAERLRIHSSGATTMHVNNEDHETFRFTTQGVDEAKLIMKDASDNDDIVLNTGGSSWINGGNFGIGTNGPGAPLHILSTAYPTALIQRNHGTNYPRLRLTNTSNHGADLDGIGDGSPAGGFRISTVNAATSTERFRIYGDGTVRIRGVNRNSPFTVSNVSGTVFILDDTQPSAVGTGGKIVFGSKYYTAANTMGTAFIGASKDNAPSNGSNEYEHSLIFGANSSSAGFSEKMRLTHRGCLFIHDGSPSPTNVNSKTRLEVRGSAGGGSFVDTDYFKGFKIALDDATEWGGQAQHAVGRYEESGASARTSYMISLGHGNINSSSDADVNVMEMRSNGCVMTPGQPSFGCIKSGSQYPTSGQRVTIAPWTEHFDQGGYFNATTGVFTAPVAGKYFFYVSVMMDRNDNGDYQISIYRNGAIYYNSNDMLSNANVTYMQTTVNGIVEMSANDTVDFRMYNSTQTSSFIYHNHYTHCGGYLIG